MNTLRMDFAGAFLELWLGMTDGTGVSVCCDSYRQSPLD